MENSYRFFKNTSCKFYPCHKGIEEMNCLFCYCPLYPMKDCGGNYKMVHIERDDREVKDCSNCILPHVTENYDKVITKL